MARAEEYAKWIVANEGKKGTPEFETVAAAYRQAKQMESEQLQSQAQVESDVPVVDSYGRFVTPPIEKQKQEQGKGFIDTAIGELAGAGETALTTLTGATTAPIGMAVGTLGAIAKELRAGNFGTNEAADRIEEEAAKWAEQFTYAPRTQEGQRNVQAIGETLEPAAGAFAPLAPLTAEMQSLSAATRLAAPAVRPVVEQQLINAARQAVAEKKGQQMAGPSVGAAGVDVGTIRAEQAADLPVPIQLTEGQRSRTFEQQRFERETAKLPEAGAPIRERFADQNQQLIQNMDAFVDQTGATLGEGNLRGIGELVDKALTDRASKDKAKIRTLYKEAEKAGEMQAPVNLQPVANWLNENRASRVEEGLMSKIQRKLEAMEVSEGDLRDGSLQVRDMTLNQSEDLRKFINSETNPSDPREVRLAATLKEIIDQNTDGVGGDKYKLARAARAKFARDYENVGAVKRLLGTKPGTDDRTVALENVLDKVVLSPSTSLDEMIAVRRVLQTKTGGKEGVGAQAWREIQGGVLNHIKEQMTKNVARDQRGNPVVSAAQLDRVITQLDKSGKLDYVFGPDGANKLRLINDVAKDVLTAPPGAVNTSNTASVLAGLMDVAISGTAGAPIPVASSVRFVVSKIRDKKLKARVQKALGETE